VRGAQNKAIVRDVVVTDRLVNGVAALTRAGTCRAGCRSSRPTGSGWSGRCGWREIAALDVVLVVSFADPIVVPNVGERRSVLVTAHHRSITSLHSDVQDGFHVRMAPMTAYRLLGGASVNEFATVSRALGLILALNFAGWPFRPLLGFSGGMRRRR
jgi:hypothetical protein